MSQHENDKTSSSDTDTATERTIIRRRGPLRISKAEEKNIKILHVAYGRQQKQIVFT